MGLTRGRIVRDVREGEAQPSSPVLNVLPARRERILRDELEAKAKAARILADAEARADALMVEANEKAKDAVAIAAKEAQEREQANVAAAYLVMKAREEERAERDVDRAVGLAVVLAERLIGESIAIDPSRVAGLAREALHEARGTRRARIEAHPLDEAALLTHIAELAGPEITVTVVPNESLTRGSLILHTDLGTLDAKLTPRIDRLAAALRGALR